MASSATATYSMMRSDVDVLMGLQSVPGAPIRSTDANEPLLRAAVVLLVTAWENYVEQAVQQCFDHVLANVTEPQCLSPHLKSRLQQAASTSAWSVTGDSWRSVVSSEVAALIASLNNAASGQVDGLVMNVLGVRNFLDGVSWPSTTPDVVRADLRSLVNDVRGEIVHKGTTPTALNSSGLLEWQRFLDNLVTAADAELASAVAAIYGSPPW